jgi:hypothetical protein
MPPTCTSPKVSSATAATVGLVTHDELIAALIAAKEAVHVAVRDNATAENAGDSPPYGRIEVAERRLVLDTAVVEARNAGCDLSGLVGPAAGDPEP